MISCKSKNCSRKPELEDSAEVLLFYLNRRNGLGKLTNRVNFPEQLTVMLPSSENSYHLQSVVVHTGDNYQSGHYTSFVKSSDWYLADDMKTQVLQINYIFINKCKYFLFKSKA